VEFAYNDSMKKSIGRSMFHILYGRSPKGVVDLVALPNLDDRKNIDANDFVDNIHE